MIKKKNQNISFTQTLKNLYGYAMSTFLLSNGLKQINPTEFDLNKCTSNSSRGCILEGDPEYSKKL